MTDDQHPDAHEGDEHTADESLLQELRAVVGQVDPVPADFEAAARASLTWLTVDAELAELTFDSLVDEGAGGLVRGRQGARLLSFETSGLAVELEVVSSGARRRLAGQLDPPQPAEIKVRHARGTLSVDADQLGRFITEVGAGLVSLWCRTYAVPQVAPVVTAWVSI